MPYYTSNSHPEHPDAWVMVDSKNNVQGLHKTKAGAILQMVKFSLQENVAPGGDYALLQEAEAKTTYSPPAGVASAAKRALKWIADGKAGSGFTSTGRSRAKQLASGKAVSRDTVARMKSYFARHEVDKKATGFNSGEEGYPSPGRVAWDAWGGNAGKSWVNGINLDK
jgi:hypothetical protein